MPTITYFWAEWCGRCTEQSEIVAELAERDDVTLEKHNLDEAQDLARAHDVRSLPTLFVETDNKRVRFTGLTPRSELEDALP